MGMFDYVNVNLKCPNCGEKVGGFQTKDGSCVLGHLNFNDVMNFYSDCEKCKCWIEVNVNKNSIPEKNYVVYTRKEKEGYKRVGTLDKFIIKQKS